MARGKAVRSTPLKDAQNAVRGASQPLIAISKARLVLSNNELEEFLDWLPSARPFGKAIGISEFPGDASQLWPWGAFATISLAKEATWSSGIIRRHAEKLARFVKYSSRYERALAEGKLAECSSLLEEIEANFGTSLWLIETRLGLLSLSQGLEAVKAYAGEIIHIRQRNDIVSFLAHYISRRNEPNTTPMRFVHHVAELIEGWENAHDLGVYLRYHLSNARPTSPSEFATILRLSIGTEH